jgi:phosphoadenosine phosphosulfate reductase
MSSSSLDSLSNTDIESGYVSASSSEDLPEVFFTKPHLKYLNKQLQNLEPEGMLAYDPIWPLKQVY